MAPSGVMPVIIASRPNVYSSSPLDRAAARREEAAWIEQKLHDPDTLLVPVWRNRNLVRGIDEGTPEAVFISGEMSHTLHMQGGPWAFLGLHDGLAMFAVDISPAEDPVPNSVPSAGHPVPVWTGAGSSSAGTGSAAADE